MRGRVVGGVIAITLVGACGDNTLVTQAQPTPIACQSGTIAFPPQLFPVTGNGSTSVKAADLNGDDRIDLVTANYLDGTVSVLLGKGDGTFRDHVDYPAGAGPTSLALADLDGDGKLDVVVANQNANTVSVLAGNGDGTLRDALTSPVGMRPWFVVAGDLTGDGKPDVVSVDAADSQVSVLVNRGDGTLLPAVAYATPSSPLSVAIGEVTGDGKPDLVVASPQNNDPSIGGISVLAGNGDGTLQPHVDTWIDVSPYWIALADLSGDGKLDLVATGNFSEDLEVLLGRGDGTFGTGVTYSIDSPIHMPADALTVGDLDGDGYADLLACHGPYGRTLSVLGGHGDGTFGAPVDYPLASNVCSGGAVADLDGDRRQDFVYSSGASVVTVMLGAGGGVLATEPPPVFAGPDVSNTAFAAGDLDGDGIPDLVIADSQGDTVVQLGNGNGTFRPGADLGALGLGPLALADVDRDGILDLLTATNVWLGNGDGTFRVGSSNAIMQIATSIAVGDLDGNGTPDFVVGELWGDLASVYLGNGDGTFQPRLDLPTGDLASSVSIADLDGDGVLDLVVSNEAPQTVRIFPGNGDGTFGAPHDVAVGASPGKVVAADITGDQLAELLVSFPDRGSIAVLVNRGDGTFAAPVEYLVPSRGGSEFTLAQVAGDGALDLVVPNSGAVVSIFLGAGDGSFGPRADYGADEAFGIAVLDLDGDGIVDFVLGGGADVRTVLGKCLPDP